MFQLKKASWFPTLLAFFRYIQQQFSLLQPDRNQPFTPWGQEVDDESRGVQLFIEAHLILRWLLLTSWTLINEGNTKLTNALRIGRGSISQISCFQTKRCCGLKHRTLYFAFWIINLSIHLPFGHGWMYPKSPVAFRCRLVEIQPFEGWCSSCGTT